MSRHAHEAALEPGLPIIDPHHHLWDLRPHLAHLPRGHALIEGLRDTLCYELEDLVRDASKGHDVRATVYMECGSSYRPDGPEELRPVGEVEFANRIAEQSVARGKFGACAGIVGHADFLLGDAVARTLEAEVSAAPHRLKGVRHMAAHDADPAVLGPTSRAPANMLASDTFRAGFAHLQRLGLSFDAWVLEPQLKDATALAQAFPRTTIVLDHSGAPLGIASYEGCLVERSDLASQHARAGTLPERRRQAGRARQRTVRRCSW
jgi:predicted TIM-barrel fold metal-dependent hydrolase